MSYDHIPDEVPILSGEGIALRELSEEDLPAWFQRLSDPEAAALAGDPVPSSMREVVGHLEHHRKAFTAKEGLRWAIVPEGIGASVGSIGLGSFDQANRSAQVGAAIGRAYWNRGFVTRAGHLVIEYAFHTLGIERIQADALATNAAAIRALEKLGFEREGFLRAHRVVRDTRCDSVLYSLLR
jgi:ribosomal-protein-alanine N-acetyltransferase